MQTRKQRLIEGIKAIITKDGNEDYYCQYNGLGYKFDQIDCSTWTPKADAKGVTKEFKGQIFKIGNLKIHF